MNHIRAILMLSSVAVLSLGGAAEAATAAQKAAIKCRAAIAKAGSGVIKARLKQLDACHAKRDKGKLAADCNAVDAGGLRGKLERAVSKACRGDNPVLANYAGDPAGAISTGAAVEIATSGRTLQGLPELGGDKKKLKCHAAIGKGRSGIAAGVLAASTRCQAGRDRGATTWGGLAGECVLSSELSSVRARGAIQRACSGVAGPDVASCATLPECVVTGAVDTGQRLAAMLYGGDLPARCGDGVAQGTEQCDDGNTDESDGCTRQCRLAVCGDGVVALGVEQCDDRNEFDTDDCVRCETARCGDGAVRDGVEQCDDGNDSPDDGCTGCSIDPVACGQNGVTLTVGLDFVPAAVPGVRGALVEIAYPAPRASLPGSTPVDLGDLVLSVFDPDGSRGSLVVANDRDTNSDGQDDRLTVLYIASENLPAAPNALINVLFSCQAGTRFPLGDFSCETKDATDEIGSTIRGIGCSLLGVVAR